MHNSIPSPFQLYSEPAISIAKALLRIVHLFVAYSAPISHLITLVILGLTYTQSWPSTPFFFWALACLFAYSFADSLCHLHFLYCLRTLNSPDFAIPLIYPSPSERERVLRGVLSSFQTGDETRECFSQWFYHPNPSVLIWDGRSGQVEFEDIRLENVKEFVASILFSSIPEQLDQTRTQELEEDIELIESVLDYQFPEGRNQSVQCLRPNLEPIKAEYRPLMFYTIIHSIRLCFNLGFYAFGFRKGTVQTPGGPFGYWYHPGTLEPSQTAPRPVPLVLISGLGGIITLFNYAIGLLWRTKRPMFLVGNESVSLNMFSTVHQLMNAGSPETHNQDAEDLNAEDARKERWFNVPHSSNMRPMVLSLHEQTMGVRKMLRQHGFCPISQSTLQQNGGAFVIGHSLGTLLTSYLDREASDWVVGTIAIDPISVLTFLPDLVRTFVYAHPTTLGEMLVRLLAREIGICTVIQRHFYWFQFVTLDPTPRTHYILSEDDALVNHQKVVSYLARHSIPATTLESTPHGGFLFHHLPAVLELTVKLMKQATPAGPSTPPRLPRKMSRIAFQFPAPILIHRPPPSTPGTTPPTTTPSSPMDVSGTVGMTVSFSFTSPPLMALASPPAATTRRRIARRLSLTQPLPKI